nr:putative ribonuclease H-like domain-containing protein [Tanacetum cinerariifolium]
PPFSLDPKSSYVDGSKLSSDDGKKVDEDPRKRSECKDPEKEDNVNSTNNVNSVSSTINAAGTNEVNADGGIISSELSFNTNMPALEDVSIFNFLSDHEDDAIQTRKMLKNLEEHGFVSTIQQRTNHKDLQNSLFACFLSHEELRKDEKGIVIRNKARLVAQGYTQQEGIDYDEVFTSVTRIEVIKLFLAYASFQDFMVYQMDVKNAFLYGKIEEEVYVCQPPGFEDQDFSDKGKDTAFWFMHFSSCVLVPAFCLLRFGSAIWSCVLPKDKLRFAVRLVAFCCKARCILLQSSLRFASKLVAFCFKTRCVLLQDILRFVSRFLRFVLWLHCVLSTFEDLICVLVEGISGKNFLQSAQDRDVGLGGSRFRNFTKKESMKKAFQDMLHELRGS